VRRINFITLVLAAGPLQLAFFAAHIVITQKFATAQALRESLPVLYLAVTYLQWLGVAFFISLSTGRRVPLLMHLPHLLSFLPLLRHIMLAADRMPTDTTSLSLAWVHAVVTHIFSLIATWLWQMRISNEAVLADRRREFLPIALYTILLITTILTYAGLDFSFEAGTSPFALGLVLLLLQIMVTLLLITRLRHRTGPMVLIAAAAFAIVNLVLLFDRSRSNLGVEIALAATSFTQIFSLYVFFNYCPGAAPHADTPTYTDHSPHTKHV
jgi:hypothetical protein